jgi:hypothetical protein
LQRLVEWVRQVAEDDPDALSSFCGMELTLYFELRGEVRGEAARIKVTLRPPQGEPDQRMQVELIPGREGILSFARELGAELEHFPVRSSISVPAT